MLVILKNRFFTQSALCALLLSTTLTQALPDWRRYTSLRNLALMGTAATAAYLSWRTYQQATLIEKMNREHETWRPLIQATEVPAGVSVVKSHAETQTTQDPSYALLSEQQLFANRTQADGSISPINNGLTNIHTYIDQKHTNEQHKVWKKIGDGACVYNHFMYGTTPRNQLHRAHLKDITDLLWFFYAMALYKNQGFIEGSFVIHDPGFKIYNYMLEYVQEHDTDWQNEKYLSGGRLAYCRASSHLKEYYAATGQPKHLHYGIEAKNLLPAGKGHILFGILDESKHLLFIKPEDAGLSISTEGLTHTLQLGRSIAVKALGYNYDDSATFRKERPILHVTQQIRNFLMRTQIERYPELFKQCKGRGLSWAIKNKDMFDDEIQKLITECEYAYDHLDTRIGREVILKKEDCLPGLLMYFNNDNHYRPEFNYTIWISLQKLYEAQNWIACKNHERLKAEHVEGTNFHTNVTTFEGLGLTTTSTDVLTKCPQLKKSSEFLQGPESTMLAVLEDAIN